MSLKKRYQSAIDGGLNPLFASVVANGGMSLEEALGDMDMDKESLPFDPNTDLDCDTDFDNNHLPF